MDRTKVIILGAAGRDFHNFNVVFRDREAYEVVAFTAAQIPGVVGRKYPASLAGKLSPGGVPLFSGGGLPDPVPPLSSRLCVFSVNEASSGNVILRTPHPNPPC